MISMNGDCSVREARRLKMLDIRCWACARIDEKKGNITEIHSMDYKGKGVFICPVCGSTVDFSEDTYTIEISRRYEDMELITEYLKHDNTKLKEKYPDMDPQDIEDDIDETFIDLPFGNYRYEIYYCWSGPFEGDWDLNTYPLLIEPVTMEAGSEGPCQREDEGV